MTTEPLTIGTEDHWTWIADLIAEAEAPVQQSAPKPAAAKPRIRPTLHTSSDSDVVTASYVAADGMAVYVPVAGTFRGWA